jgi:hypothetical protein
MGEKVRIATYGSKAVVLMDSISYVDAADAGQIVVSGSHGGLSSGRYAVEHPLAACFLNDAGVGKDDAGIASLAMLDKVGLACATYGSQSARIGDAADAWSCGIVSHVNRTAQALGFRTGERVADAIARVFGGGGQ